MANAGIINTTSGGIVEVAGALVEGPPGVWSLIPSAAPGYVPTSRTISTTAPLTGGGDLTINRTIAIPAATTLADGYMTTAQVTDLADRIPLSLASGANLGLYSTAINTWNTFSLTSQWRDLLGTTKASWTEATGVLSAYGLLVDPAPVVVQTGAPGKLVWNDEDGTIEFQLKGGNVTLQVGQETVLRVRNSEVTPLAEGEVVYISGSTGVHNTVLRADNTTEAGSDRVVGVVTEVIAASPGEGYVTTSGLVRNINTNHLTEGALVYLGAGGATTATEPVAPVHTVIVGMCIKKSGGAGIIFVHVTAYPELTELHDVKVTGLLTGDSLVYDSVLGYWKNQTALAAAWLLKAGDTMTGPLVLAASGAGAPGTAALKIPSGPLLLAPEAGAIERLVDKLYFTINTGTSRKQVVLADSDLTLGRIPYTSTDGRLADNAVLAYDYLTGNVTHGASLSTLKLGVGTAAPTFLGTKLNVGTSLGSMGSSAAVAHFVDNSVNATVNYQNTNAAGYSAFDLFNSAGTKVTTFAWSNASAGFLPGVMWFMTRTASDMVLGTNTTERVRIKSTGEVQIANLTANRPVYTDASKGLTTTAQGQYLACTTKTANYTLVPTDCVIGGDTSGGSFTLTLPTAVGYNGLTFTLKSKSLLNTLSFATTGGQTVDGETTGIIPPRHSLMVISDGANWDII